MGKVGMVGKQELWSNLVVSISDCVNRMIRIYDIFLLCLSLWGGCGIMNYDLWTPSPALYKLTFYEAQRGFQSAI